MRRTENDQYSTHIIIKYPDRWQIVMWRVTFLTRELFLVHKKIMLIPASAVNSTDTNFFLKCDNTIYLGWKKINGEISVEI